MGIIFGEMASKWPKKKKLNLAFGLFESPHMVHGRVSTRELCLRPSHTQEHMDSVVGGSTAV